MNRYVTALLLVQLWSIINRPQRDKRSGGFNGLSGWLGHLSTSPFLLDLNLLLTTLNPTPTTGAAEEEEEGGPSIDQPD